MHSKSINLEELIQKAKALILKHYNESERSFIILWEHSLSVMQACIRIMDLHPEIKLDKKKVILGALLHDIGIRFTDAPDLGCYGKKPYLAHGYLGFELLSKEKGYEDIAPFCERHTGSGIKKEVIIENKLPLPQRDLIPISMEEKLVCFADKFFSKSKKDLSLPIALEKVINSQSKHGKYNIDRFNEFINIFGTTAIYDTSRQEP